MVNESASLEDRKGAPIELRGASLKKHYKYEAAWKDLAKDATECYVYVIIEYPDSNLKSRRILADNIVEATPDPQTYTEAAFAQYPELHVALDDFTLKLAKCSVSASRELSTIIKKSLDRNTIKVMKKGHKMLWYVDETGLPEPTAGDQNMV